MSNLQMNPWIFEIFHQNFYLLSAPIENTETFSSSAPHPSQFSNLFVLLIPLNVLINLPLILQQFQKQVISLSLSLSLSLSNSRSRSESHYSWAPVPLFPRSSHWPRINPVVPSQAPSIYYPSCIQVLWYKFTSLHCSTPTPTEIYIFCSTCARAVRSYLVISSFTKNSQTSFNSFSTVQEPIHVTRYQEKNCNS